jgi:hypothetical protein
MSLRTSALAVVLALAAPGVMAGDPLYKSTMPDGRIVYGESPMQGAKRVDKVNTPPEVAGVVVATPADKAAAGRIAEPRGGVSVIPQQVRPPIQPAQQGSSVNPSGALPGRY